MKQIWEAPYKHNRRKHRHRCRVCDRIMETGDDALWARVRTSPTRASTRTYVMHLEHAFERTPDGITWREVFEAWAKN